MEYRLPPNPARTSKSQPRLSLYRIYFTFLHKVASFYVTIPGFLQILYNTRYVLPALPAGTYISSQRHLRRQTGLPHPLRRQVPKSVPGVLGWNRAGEGRSTERAVNVPRFRLYDTLRPNGRCTLYFPYQRAPEGFPVSHPGLQSKGFHRQGCLQQVHGAS